MKSFAQKIGVVDGNKVLESYSEYAAANTKLQGIIKSWQDTLGMMQRQQRTNSTAIPRSARRCPRTLLPRQMKSSRRCRTYAEL